MDNYFSTVGLFKILRDIQCGACGTTRRQGGIPSQLVELRDHIKSILWGRLYSSEAQGVLCLAWQDSNVVLLLSTIHSPYLYTRTKRKRPAATSTNAAIACAPFGTDFEKELDIPTAINDYNYHMGGVDIANQYRASYEIHRKTNRSWFPLFYYFLDASIINAWRIQCIYKQQHQQPVNSQLAFRQKLYRELFAFAAQAARPRPPPNCQQGQGQGHQRYKLDKQQACVWCQYTREKGTRGQRATRTRSGCGECGVALCKTAQCWDGYHSSD
jgi:hypothetical protein